MKCIKLFQSIKNVISMLFILMISTSTLSGNKLLAQNMSLMNTPLLLNNIAGEINGFNIFQIVSNPAILESLKNNNIGFYSERKFNLIELSNHHIVSGFSFGKMKFGINIQQAGTTKFNQYALGLCFSKKIGENTSLGIRSSLLKTNISKYAKQQYISAQIGISTYLSKIIKLGFTATNYMSFSKQTPLDNAYYINIATGLFYDISKQFSMQLNCSKTSNLPTVFSGLVKYQVHKKIALKLGFVSNTNATNIEFAHSGKKMNLSLIFSLHPNLGITPATSISTTNE